jgi:anti-sigma-K factor RskA
MSEQHPIDLLPAFALECLENNEREAVRRHLRDCDDCRRELAAYQQVTDRLAFGAPVDCPPELLKQRLMAHIAPRRNAFAWLEKLTIAWPRLIPATAVGGLILVIALGVSNIILWRQMARRDTTALENTRLVRLQATVNAPGATGVLVLGPDESRALLVVDALMPLAAKSQYQLWLIKNGRRDSGGVFSVTADGRAELLVVAGRPLADFDAFGITIEPFGGSPGPTGKKVLGGKMKL